MNKTLKKSSAPKLTPEEKYWNQVEQQAHYQIADLFNQTLPFPNLRDKKNFDLDQDGDWRTLLADYGNNYAEAKSLPESEVLAEEIAYEYLLLVAKVLLRKLSGFSCHQADYFENLTN